MLSPLDDRYFEKVRNLHDYFSEDAQLKIKTRIEIDYFVAICNEIDLQLSDENYNDLMTIYESIEPIAIKLREEVTKHDIKAIEYYLRERFKNFNIPHDQYIHFGLTSQDINSLAMSTMLQRFNENEMVSDMNEMIGTLFDFGDRNNTIFPARTHGQLAVPTTFQKEIDVFAHRLQEVVLNLVDYKFSAKFGGAVGNLSAHYIAYPDKDWRSFMNSFVLKHDISREQITTQVSHNHSLCRYFDSIRMINNILIGLCRDIWMYNSYGYFKQTVTAGEIGSSTMPQKINPIAFENAEGNLELSNALLSFMSDKLQISRMQRDLSDSTVLRNVGVALGHATVAYKSIIEGLKKLSINREVVDKDLASTGLLAEAYQVLLKKENVKDGYELIKNMERSGDKIDSLEFSQEVKNILKAVTIDSYITHMRN